MDKYSFRVFFLRAPTYELHIDVPKLSLPSPNESHNVFLASADPDKTIKNSERLVLISSGWSTEEEADKQARIYWNALELSLVKLRIGADFGNRGPKSFFYKGGLEMVEAQIKQRALNNIHGLMVYETNQKPVFVSTGEVNLTTGATQEKFEACFKNSIYNPRKLNDREKLSIELFNSSFFQKSSDARFLLLVMAIEALIKPVERSHEAKIHVEELIKQTRTSTSLSKKEKDSIAGSLEWLKCESINQTGKKLAVERLGSRTYMDKDPAKFFSYCYDLRSKFVHGNLSQEKYKEIGSAAANLQNFVSDLLSGPLLEL